MLQIRPLLTLILNCRDDIRVVRPVPPPILHKNIVYIVNNIDVKNLFKVFYFGLKMWFFKVFYFC